MYVVFLALYYVVQGNVIFEGAPPPSLPPRSKIEFRIQLVFFCLVMVSIVSFLLWLFSPRLCSLYYEWGMRRNWGISMTPFPVNSNPPTSPSPYATDQPRPTPTAPPIPSPPRVLSCHEILFIPSFSKVGFGKGLVLKVRVVIVVSLPSIFQQPLPFGKGRLVSEHFDVAGKLLHQHVVAWARDTHRQGSGVHQRGLEVVCRLQQVCSSLHENFVGLALCREIVCRQVVWGLCQLLVKLSPSAV
ncbi:hypothetical protein L3X38_012345 [Prunus dulcis]|uniref:Uncharacterized protein n=1 Tax=Prunus dulcis TaxID=3755 RepID=A0AAD4ZGJ5_PRUDU|nr:hypothetical protein L3X38_012345 [Prunus dulcis]